MDSPPTVLAPVSPLGLVQEHPEVRKDPWRVLVACALCNRTPGERALPVLLALLAEWPKAVHLAGAPLHAVSSVVRPLGFQRRRAEQLIRLSAGYLTRYPRTRDDVVDLVGVGTYAADAWSLFVEDSTDDVHPTDRYLRRWLDWRLGCTP